MKCTPILVAGAAMIIALPNPATAQSFNQFIGFGDSTIDSGWYNAAFPPLGGAAFNNFFNAAIAEDPRASAPTSSPGLMSSQVLAGRFGLAADPANQPGGTNYATSGARNNNVNMPGDGLFRGAVPTVTQINNYLAANGGRANANALYLISSGANDVAFAIDNPGGQVPDPDAYIASAANDLIAGVANLRSAGARYIVVPNLPESFGNQTFREKRALYNDALWSGLAAAGVNFIPADNNSVRQAIAANPSAFGFQFVNTANPACVNPGVGGAWALLCATSVSALVEPEADQTRLFADDSHLATAGQKIIGDYHYSLVIAPSQISLLAEAPLKMRDNFISAIENQIAVAHRHKRPYGINIWVTGDVSRLTMENYPGFTDVAGTPAALMGGITYRSPSGWLAGGALSANRQKAKYDLGGSFTGKEFAAGAYFGFAGGPVWFSIVGAYGSLDYDVNRIVPIGITQQGNNGSTSGHNASLALLTGLNFVNGPLTHGPVAGVTVQRVRVDAFTETGSFTSLSFGDQTRDSAVSRLGYQLSYDFGIWRPFAQVTWHHEWAATNRLVTASLTTTVAPSYALPAVVFGKDWARAMVGTTVALGPSVTGIMSVTSQAGQEGATFYGVQVGLNAAF